MPWSLLPLLLPLGLMAGLLSGLLGIGGGLVFSPLLLLMGLSPHVALATSTLAIVPTTCGGTWAHLRNRSLPWKGGLAIGAGAVLGSALFSQVGFGLQGWLLLALQAGMYGLLSVVIRSSTTLPADATAGESRGGLTGLAGVGAVAGLASGMLGVGGGLVMVPLMVRMLAVPVHLAIRFSTLAVLTASATASVAFVQQERALVPVGLVLGATAALGAQWSAKRLNRVPEAQLVWLLRALTIFLAIDSGRRAIQLLLAS
jgi:uncharacterized membrane protein YfcA